MFVSDFCRYSYYKNTNINCSSRAGVTELKLDQLLHSTSPQFVIMQQARVEFKRKHIPTCCCSSSAGVTELKLDQLLHSTSTSLGGIASLLPLWRANSARDLGEAAKCSHRCDGTSTRSCEHLGGSTLQYSIKYSTVRYGTGRYGTVQYGTVRYSNKHHIRSFKCTGAT